MPLVISHKAKCKYYIRSEEILTEILGHSDFDGEYWAIGDIIIFEDGTEARIVQAEGEMFHLWSKPIPSDLRKVVEQLNHYHPVQPLKLSAIDSWDTLFDILAKERAVTSKGCFPQLMIIVTIGMVIGIAAAKQMA
ncbi:hypothetical protein N9A86_04475 [Akkermansiaceae bacterium]|nr:hypothetical protein [Akkermansiaceae bacterium]MDB4537900.1 hypothetical protein [Akkermansiaceae bacterium]